MSVPDRDEGFHLDVPLECLECGWTGMDTDCETEQHRDNYKIHYCPECGSHRTQNLID